MVFPNCKINLGLHILQKRKDGFHDLETIFYPIPLQDALEIIPIDTKDQELHFTASGLTIDTHFQNNICVKAYYLLKKDYPALPPIGMHLHKCIPMGAGLGGGSADGAFTLLLLNKRFNLGLTSAQLVNYALQLGSDCPFFIHNKPCFASGRGEKMIPLNLDLSAYRFIVVNPGIHINTGWAFSQLTLNNTRSSLQEIIQLPVAQWKDRLVNDFENPIFAAHPEIKQIKEHFYQQGAIYASMTGSGSTVYALFLKGTNPQLDFPKDYFVKEL